MPEPSGTDQLWSVYLVRCRDGSLYTGIAIDVARRLDSHRSGTAGAKYLRGRAPLDLVGQWPIGDRSLATRVERRIKRMTKAGKEQLIIRPGRIERILSDLGSAAAVDC